MYMAVFVHETLRRTFTVHNGSYMYMYIVHCNLVLELFLHTPHVGEKAVECLMESKWTKEPKDSHDSLTPYFKTRTNAIDYCIQ